MRKFLKILAIGFAVLAVLGLIATAALRVFFPPAKLRKLVENQIRKQLNREVRLGEVQLGLRGLALKRFTLSEIPTFSAGTVLDVDQARVRWTLLPFRPRKIVLHIHEGTLYSGARAARLASVLSDIDLAVWDFDATRAQGRLSIDQLQNPVYTAKDFAVDWNVQNIDASLSRLNGWMRLKQGPGMVQNIEKLAAASQSARVTLMPLVLLQNLQRSGLSIQGLPDLSRLAIHTIQGDYGFKNGLMQINRFDINGPELSMSALGTIQLPDGRLAVNAVLKSPKAQLLGATELKISIGGTVSNPKSNLDSLKKQAFKATVNQVLQDPKTMKAIDKTLKNLFK